SPRQPLSAARRAGEGRVQSAGSTTSRVGRESAPGVRVRDGRNAMKGLASKHGCLLAMFVVAILIAAPATATPPARALSFADAVKAQPAIERVYWEHRIWPKENPTAKPPLEAVMPNSAIRAKVEDYLEKSNALERFWSRPIGSEQLQAEM